MRAASHGPARCGHLQTLLLTLRSLGFAGSQPAPVPSLSAAPNRARWNYVHWMWQGLSLQQCPVSLQHPTGLAACKTGSTESCKPCWISKSVIFANAPAYTTLTGCCRVSASSSPQSLSSTQQGSSPARLGQQGAASPAGSAGCQHCEILRHEPGQHTWARQASSPCSKSECCSQE